MCKQIEKIVLLGEKIGYIWMPQVECTKDFSVTFTPKDQPFTRKWEGLEDALNFITNDGDFQNCELSFLSGYARWYDPEKRVYIEKELQFNFKAKIFKGYVNHEYL